MILSFANIWWNQVDYLTVKFDTLENTSIVVVFSSS